MTDYMNDPASGEDREARLRADKIGRIKASMRKREEQSSPAPTPAPVPAEEPAAKAVLGEDSDWEAEIAKRIALKAGAIKQKKEAEAARILRELDVAAETKPAPEEAFEAPSEPFAYAEEVPEAPAERVQEAPAEELYAPAEPEAAEEIVPELTKASVFDDLPDDPAEAFAPDNSVEAILAELAAAEKAAAAPKREEPSPFARPSAPARRPEAPSREIPAEPARSGVRAEREALAEEKSAPAVGEAELPEEKPSKKKKKKKKSKKKKTFKQRVRGLFPEKGDSVLECIRKVVFLAAMIAIIVCGYMVGDYYFDLWRAKRLNDKVMNLYWTYQDDEAQKPSKVEVVGDNGEKEVKMRYTMLPGARKLLDMNDDVVGVICIPGTKVNNPLMQADDNTKYLNQKIDGSKSRTGEIFLDYRNHFDDVDDEGYLKYPNSDNLVIYGHNMGDDTMFGELKYYHRNSDFYGEHPVIELNSNYATYKYKIFAFFILDAEDETDTKFDCWNKLDFYDEKDFYDFVNEAKRRTIRLNDVDVKYGDSLVTLSTCNTYLGDRGRLIVMGRLVREGEDAKSGTQNSRANPNIKWPTMYYNTKTNEKYDPDADFEPYGP